VLLRATLLAGIAVACTGCAGDNQLGSGFAASPVTSALAAPAAGQMPRKTMSDKVLAAMALERVTGLKPDPSRFLASN
jgi:hypothetical protein